MNIHKLENAHIPLWLIKDLCWLMKFKAIGVIVAFPTITVAILLAVITRRDDTRFIPNIAVSFWILANSLWMFGEFFDWEHSHFQPVCLALFISGIITYCVFVALQYRKKM